MTVLAGMKNERVIFRSEAFIWQNAAGGTNNRNDIAPADIHRDAIHGVNGAAIIVLFQIRYFYDLLRHLRHRSFPL